MDIPTSYTPSNTIAPTLRFHLGTLNVRTLGDSAATSVDEGNHVIARLPIFVQQLKQANVAICCLQECRVPEACIIESVEHYVVFCSHATIVRGGRYHGVGIALKKEWREDVQFWRIISSRLVVLAGCFDGIKIVIICHYAPIMATGERELSLNGQMGSCEDHYAALAQVLADIPLEYCRRFVAGDANAMVGNVDEDIWRLQLGPYIQDAKWNHNGIHMLNFCFKEGFWVANSLFDQAANGSGTYRAPGQREYSKTLDYILVRVERREEITACFVWPEDGMYAFTDHRMVVADIEIRQGVTIRETRYRVGTDIKQEHQQR